MQQHIRHPLLLNLLMVGVTLTIRKKTATDASMYQALVAVKNHLWSV